MSFFLGGGGGIDSRCVTRNYSAVERATVALQQPLKVRDKMNSRLVLSLLKNVEINPLTPN